jgi:hypothetical protein
VYCRGTLKALANASIELHKGTNDTETYRVRITARKAFELHVKERPDAKGRTMLRRRRTMLRCPAIGPSPTVTCPLRELLKTKKPVTDKERLAVDPEDVPDFADKICAHTPLRSTPPSSAGRNSFSTTAPGAGRVPHHARNRIESLNA